MRKPLEGFMVQLRSGHIFDVKGLIHPPGRVVAYPRYVPDPLGPRRRGRMSFRKLRSWQERLSVIRGEFSSFLVLDPVLGDEFCEVPWPEIARVFDPVEGLEALRAGARAGLRGAAVRMADEVAGRAGLGRGEIGISGSLLVGLEGPGSDIDIVVYGRKACLRAYEALRSMREEGITRPLEGPALRAILEERSRDTPYDARDFFAREPKKLLQGFFMGYSYSARLVPAEEPEPYGLTRFRPLGTAVIRGVVADASESMFTPCRYVVEDVEVLQGPGELVPGELVSFRMRFCEHLEEADVFEARGKLELVLGPGEKRIIRLLVGGRPGDYIRPSRPPRP